jgi:hypothetical protein
MRSSMNTAAAPFALMRAPSEISGALRDSVKDIMAAVRPALTAARAFGAIIYKALHDSRQLQAEREIARHRDLIASIRNSRKPSDRRIP